MLNNTRLFSNAQWVKTKISFYFLSSNKCLIGWSFLYIICSIKRDQNFLFFFFLTACTLHELYCKSLWLLWWRKLWITLHIWEEFSDTEEAVLNLEILEYLGIRKGILEVVLVAGEDIIKIQELLQRIIMALVGKLDCKKGRKYFIGYSHIKQWLTGNYAIENYKP